MNRMIHILMVFLFCSALAAQTRDCELIGRWAHGCAYTAELNDNLLYYGNGGYLEIRDMSDLLSYPALVGQWLAPGPVYCVTVRGDYAYVACGGEGLYILNISDPANPVETGSAPVDYRASDVVLNSAYAYVADKYYGIRIVDIADPAAPAETGFCPLTSAERLTYQDGYVYASNERRGIYTIDVSDPAAPVKTDSSVTGFVYDVEADGSSLYAVTGDSLHMYRIADPAHPVKISSIGGGGYKRGVTALDGTAYVSDYYSGLIGFDVSDPANPAELFAVDLGAGNPASGFVTGSTAYMAVEHFGIKIVDVSDPASAQVVGDIYTGGSSRKVVVDGHYAYVTQGKGGLRILDITDPAAPVEAGRYNGVLNVYNLTIHGKVAVLSQGDYGPTVLLDITDPANPDSLGQIVSDDLRYSNDCRIMDHTAYLALGSRGFGIADITDPANPVVIGFCDTPGWGSRLDVGGQYAYVADHDSLFIIDMSDQAHPVRAAAIAGRRSVYDVVVRDSYAYVADTYEGLTVVDISDPFHPAIAGTRKTQRAYGVELKGNIAYIADYGGGIVILDISDPASPEFMGRYNTPSAVDGVAVDDRDYIYGADEEDGLYIVRYTGTDGIETPDVMNIKGYGLASNFPNPFNPSTAVRYSVPVRSLVELNVYNIRGQLVARLFNGEKEAGRHTAVWDGTDMHHRSVPAGIYLCRMNSGDFVKTIRMALVR
ncbi:T9SS type A sorting domain-containing protein [bacterium]|nr:T9SS type A sorting domain-containing protein [bacterium]